VVHVAPRGDCDAADLEARAAQELRHTDERARRIVSVVKVAAIDVTACITSPASMPLSAAASPVCGSMPRWPATYSVSPLRTASLKGSGCAPATTAGGR